MFGYEFKLALNFAEGFILYRDELNMLLYSIKAYLTLYMLYILGLKYTNKHVNICALLCTQLSGEFQPLLFHVACLLMEVQCQMKNEEL